MRSPIAGLVGTWRGSGAGEFPTMDPFAYDEEVRFVDLGVPALIYQQRAWSEDELLHLETGLWRADDAGNMAVTISLPRVAEVSEGRIVDGRIELEASSITRAEGGARLVAVRRTYELIDDAIAYRVAMATEDVPEPTHHLAGELHRVPGDGSAAAGFG